MLGTILGLVSAVAYTAANVCLRASIKSDLVWVSCIKSIPTIALVAPWLLVLAARGERILPPLRVLLLIVAAGAFGQLGGNVAFQYSLGVVGVAMAVPLTLGTMILSAAVLGRLILHEPVTPRMAVSILLLLVAIGVFCLGAKEASESVQTGSETLSFDALRIAAGVTAALASGVAYTILGVAIRYAAGKGAAQATTLMTVALVGLISLGAVSLIRIGPQGMLGTPPRDLAIMLAAGVFNAVAFVALTKALQLTTVVYFNALNATQAAMAAIGGVIFFQESPSLALLAGVVLTTAGLLLMRERKPRTSPTELEEHSVAEQCALGCIGEAAVASSAAHAEPTQSANESR